MQVMASPRWDDVRIFLEVFRAGNLSEAAKRLAVDASTVSRRLAALESDLGAALFDRTREGLAPTARAEELHAAAERMEEAHLAFSTGAARFEVAPEGLVRITAPPGLADAFVAPALATLLARYPKLRIELDASTRVMNLTRKEADLAVRTVPSEGAELVTVKLLTTRWVLAGQAKYVAELGKLRSLEHVRLVDWGEDLAHLHGSRWLKSHAKGAVPVLRTSHFASQLAAVAAGIGLALVPEPYLALHDLVPAKLGPELAVAAAELPEDHAWLTGHRALRHVPRVAVVWDHLHEAMVALARGSGSQKQKRAALSALPAHSRRK